MLLCMLFVALWLAGGGSRADIMAQVVIRAIAWIVLACALLFGQSPSWNVARPVWIFLLAVVALTLLQLVPLPPAVWQALPGRSPFSEAAVVTRQPQPWRPLAIVPAGAFNTLGSLIVPLTALVLLTGLSAQDRQRLPGLFLLLIASSTLIGLLQLSGATYSNPLLNDIPGQISGIFANRNHYALFLSLGCVLAPSWAFFRPQGVERGQHKLWRAPLAIGLVLVLMLLVLGTGSRAGMLIGALALAAGVLLAWRRIGRALRHYPRRWVIAGGVAVAALAVALVLASVMADRATSIVRVVALDPGQDMRARGLPTVLAMIRTYFPAGTGFGSFDQMFRFHEPFSVLKPSYFNHAHDDLLEIVLEAGLPGALLLIGALAWWVVAGTKALRLARAGGDTLPAQGAIMLLLVAVASAFDYPGRTPMMMTTIVLAAFWLNFTGKPDESPSFTPAGRASIAA